MRIYPAIDLKNGQCVRLRQGRADDAVVYGADPVAMAQQWEAQGADWLHVVDLDGAFQGEPVHTELILQIVKAISIPVQVGGGMRDGADAKRLVKGGVRRVIFGSRAVSHPEALAETVRELGAAVAVGIDARDGKVQVRGWVETTAMLAVDLGRRMEEMGVQTLIYTDTARDGMLRGVNTAAVDGMCAAVSCGVIASGGVAAVDDIEALRALGRKNLDGAIVGKALYESRVTMDALKAACR
ncbi:MAG: 1-(5-phosphoribosyl)-5-[(5-phosphoribosylamino)methylideneamino]imidazole-4-carboxamide isomerase [Verrucomicrobia bacterium]|nr:1-(5-phosphoribosyl)-5-[(5-phosphoribosylamino)methylideneamino]imidazole-4-carboxamide isomerase [Verrucomicrobiota bacterium]